MVERPIHILKVAGSNPEVGNIFSERYQRKEVQGEREREYDGDIGKEGEIWEHEIAFSF